MNLNTKTYFAVYNTCKLVKGKRRGTITDLQRNKIELVPNELIDLLNKFNGQKLSNIYTYDYNREDLKTIEGYFEFLIENEIIFLSKDKPSFYTSSQTYESPKRLVSAIIDINKDSKYEVSEAVLKINDIGCDNLQIRMYDCMIDPYKLRGIVSLLDNTSFRHVEILIKYEAKFIADFQEIFKHCNRISIVYFHSYDDRDKVEEVDSIKYIYTSEKIISSDFCGYILPFYFDISPITYYIGEEYNTCLYKKIAIDVHGNIKNCPSMMNEFGKIESANLDEIIIEPKFKKYWNITKDKISVCKMCEFRKVCTDCRAYLNENELYKKPKHCSYDPSNPNW